MTPSDNTELQWKHLFDNYQQAMEKLTDAITLATTRPLTKLEQLWLIQSFKFTHELAWKTLRDFLTHRGVSEITDPRDVCRAAFKAKVLDDGEVWMARSKAVNSSITLDSAVFNA